MRCQGRVRAKRALAKGSCGRDAMSRAVRCSKVRECHLGDVVQLFTACTLSSSRVCLESRILQESREQKHVMTNTALHTVPRLFLLLIIIAFVAHLRHNGTHSTHGYWDWHQLHGGHHCWHAILVSHRLNIKRHWSRPCWEHRCVWMNRPTAAGSACRWEAPLTDPPRGGYSGCHHCHPVHCCQRRGHSD